MKLQAKHIFPCLLIVMNLGASVVCAINGDYKKSVYWLAAAVLNITVTF